VTYHKRKVNLYRQNSFTWLFTRLVVQFNCYLFIRFVLPNNTFQISLHIVSTHLLTPWLLL